MAAIRDSAASNGTSDVLFRGAYLATQDVSFGELIGDLLVRDGKIEYVGPHIPEATPLDGVEIIDATDYVVLPGFVDTHRHLWQGLFRGYVFGKDLEGYRNAIPATYGEVLTPSDAYAGNLFSALTAPDSGTTTVCDESHIQNSPEHTDHVIAANEESGTRIVFDYGWPSTEAWSWLVDSTRFHPTYVRELREGKFANNDGLVTLAIMLRGPEMTRPEAVRADIQLARDLDLRAVFHVGAGDFGLRLQGIKQIHDLGLLGSDMTFVHCGTSSDEELRMMADAGASCSVAAAIDAHMQGMGEVATSRVLTAGVRPSLSVDIESFVAPDMFNVMRAALAAKSIAATYDPTYLDRYADFSPRDAISFATIEGARTARLDHRVGSLTPGKEADIQIVNMRASNLRGYVDPVSSIVSAGHPGNVESVMIAGRWIKRRGELVKARQVAVAEDRVREVQDRLFRATPPAAIHMASAYRPWES